MTTTVLIVLAVWCALSLLFAGAHCCWSRYADVARFPVPLGPTSGSLVWNRHEIDPAGSDVSRFFGSFARQ